MIEKRAVQIGATWAMVAFTVASVSLANLSTDALVVVGAASVLLPPAAFLAAIAAAHDRLRVAGALLALRRDADVLRMGAEHSGPSGRRRAACCPWNDRQTVPRAPVQGLMLPNTDPMGRSGDTGVGHDWRSESRPPHGAP